VRSLERVPSVGEAADPVDRRGHFQEESAAQARDLRVVVGNGLVDLLLRDLENAALPAVFREHLTDAAKSLSAQARKLTPSERLELVDDILASLDETAPDLDREWAREAEDRLAAYRRGEIKAVPLEQVLAKYRGK
jgi:putative addiction module component (TIGR02574 family)